MSRLKKIALGGIATAEAIGRGTMAAGVGELASVKTFLFLQYEQALGTAVHATPVFEALKRAVPGAHAIVACATPVRDVVRHSPYIDRLIVTPNPYAHFVTAWRAIRSGLSDLPSGARCIITTTGSTRTRIAALAVASGWVIRVGFTNAPRFYQRALTYDPALSQMENNLHIIDALGHAHGTCEPRVFFSRQQLDAARSLLTGQHLDDHRPCVVLVTQVSGGQRTRWREEHFVTVAKHLQAKGHQLLFVGTDLEVPEIECLRARLGGLSVSLAGKTDIPTLSAVMCLADLVVALDTGPMHVARAAGPPMVVIAPAWQRAVEWLPLGRDNVSVLRGPDIPAIPPDYWIDEVGAAQVGDAADHLLERFPPSPQARESRVRRSLAEPRR